MNNHVYELLLQNSTNTFSYIIDLFQENTIHSQEVILEIIDQYREKFSLLSNGNYKIVFRKICETNDTGSIKESTYKIKDVSLFTVSENSNIEFKDANPIIRKLLIYNSFDFAL